MEPQIRSLKVVFVCFIKTSLGSFCSGVIKWSEIHHLYLCHKFLFIKPYQFKPGSAFSGNAWTSIANDLCAVEEISFTVNQKLLRDRYESLANLMFDIRNRVAPSKIQDLFQDIFFLTIHVLLPYFQKSVYYLPSCITSIPIPLFALVTQ